MAGSFCVESTIDRLPDFFFCEDQKKAGNKLPAFFVMRVSSVGLALAARTTGIRVH
jgi:hypothetical protein